MEMINTKDQNNQNYNIGRDIPGECEDTTSSIGFHSKGIYFRNSYTGWLEYHSRHRLHYMKPKPDRI